MATKKEQSLEESMNRLEEVVKRLEEGNGSLDEALKLYEEGVRLVRNCTERLDAAEQRVRQLKLQADGTVALEDFLPEENG